jgi:hypothetical protein
VWRGHRSSIRDKRPTARHQPEKKGEELRPDTEFRARGFHVRVDKFPWKVLTTFAGAAAAARLAGVHLWML